MQVHPHLSIAIPAFNEGGRLPRFVEQLLQQALASPEPVVEFIVSDDGSNEEHAGRQRASVEQAAARLAEAGSPHVFRYVQAERNGGKGAAVLRAWRMAHAEARWRGFLDADGSVSAGEFFRVAALAFNSEEADVVAGSRVLMAGRTVQRRLFRHLQGRVFATIAEQLFGLGFYDTQCGVKLIRAALMEPFMDSLQERRWLLDIELLVHARRQGARSMEVPIDWIDEGDSKVIFGVDALRMLWGLLRMRSRLGAMKP